MKHYEHVLRAPADLIEYENNARTHDNGQVIQIARSIKEFGFTNPLLIDSNNNIIAGHGRLAAAVSIELETVPCIVIDNLTKAQQQALILADNQLALNAGWDMDVLRYELEELQDLDFNIDLIGFDGDFLDELLDIDAELPEMPDGDREPFQQKTFTLHDEQAQVIDSAITEAKKSPLIDTGVNDNSNGNALWYICEQWLKGVVDERTKVGNERK